MKIKIWGLNTEVRVTSITLYSPTDTAQITDITAVADSSGNLGGTYFLLSSANNDITYKVWLDVDNSSIEPVVDGTVSVEVDIATDALDTVVAGALNTAIGALPEFTTGIVGAVVTVTNDSVGQTSSPVDSGTGFTFDVTTPGATTVPAELEMFRVIGTTDDLSTVQQGSVYTHTPGARKPVDTIVQKKKILQIVEE